MNAKTLKPAMIPIVPRVAEPKITFEVKTIKKKIVMAIKLAPTAGDCRKVMLLRKPDSL